MTSIVKKLSSIIPEICITGFVCAMFFFLGPLETIAANAVSFKTTPVEAGIYFLIFAVVVFFIITLVFLFLPQKLRTILSSLLFAFSVIAYIQVNFLNPDVGFLDDNTIDWSLYSGEMIINSAIWLAVVALCVILTVFFKPFYYIKIFASIVLAGMQLVAGISLIITTSPLPETVNFSTEDLGVASSNENIFIFMIDATTNDIINQTLETYPDMLDGFNDFTRFTNYSTYFYGTKPTSVMHLTGFTDYEVEQNPSTFIEDAWADEKGYHNMLLENEFRSFLFAKGVNDNFAIYYEDVAPFIENSEITTYNIDISNYIKNVIKLTIYKYSPTFFKPYLLISTTGLDTISDSPTLSTASEIFTLISILDNEGLNYVDDKVFSYYHFQGAHIPFYMNADLKNEDSNVTEQIKGTFTVIEKFIQDLKENGVYDDSTIIILADHGDYNFLNSGNASCALFIKNKEETYSTMQINDSPVSILEYNATLLNILNADTESGDTFYDIPNEPRERSTYVYGKRPVDDPHTLCHDAFYRFDYTSHIDEVVLDVDSDEATMINIGNCLYDQIYDLQI